MARDGEQGETAGARTRIHGLLSSLTWGWGGVEHVPGGYLKKESGAISDEHIADRDTPGSTPSRPRCAWAPRSLGRSSWSDARGHLAEAGVLHQVTSSSRAFSLAVTECFVPVRCALCLKTTKQCLVTVACARISGADGAALQEEALGKAAALALKNVSNGEGMCVQLSNYVFKQT